MTENYENAPMYIFGSKRLENLHLRTKEMKIVKRRSVWNSPNTITVFMSTFKKEFDGFIYRVLYPGEFILVQKMIHGQVVPLTIKEIILKES